MMSSYSSSSTFKVLLLIVSFLVGAAALPVLIHAQTADEIEEPSGSTNFWVQAMGLYNTIGTGYGAKAVVDINRHQFMVRAIRADSREFDDHLWEIGLLYSRRKLMGNWLLSGGTGVAVVGGSRFSNVWGTTGAEPMDTMIGFPLEGELAWSPLSMLAVGLYAYADVNTGQPIGGFGLSLRVGKIR